MLFAIVLCFFIHQIPRCGQRVVQLVKERKTVTHLVDDLKMRIDNGILHTERTVVGHGNLHFFLDRADAVQILNVQHDIKDDRMVFLTGGEGTTDLLFVNDRRYRRAEQDHASHIVHMNALVERIDAVEQAKMIGIIVRFEIFE